MKNIFGQDPLVRPMTQTYLIPPFSVLDTTTTHWIRYKQQWRKKTGNLSASREEASPFGELHSLRRSAKKGSRASQEITKKPSTSEFDPVLMEVILHWFNLPAGKVFDPFGGEQTKGVVCGELGIEYHGVEIRQEQVDENKRHTKKYGCVNYYCGDARDSLQLMKSAAPFDFCFTSPPYYDLEVYSKEDLSALGTYEEFMDAYEDIFTQAYALLNENRFFAVKISEIRDKKGVYRNFVGDNIDIFTRIGFKYYNEIILLNSIGSLAFRSKPMDVNRKIGKRHQNILVFYKGDVSKIKSIYPKITDI